MNTVVQVPTRSTSYTHLRDAFVRTLQTRQRLANQAGDLSPDEQLALQAPISQLKTVFPNAPFVKDTPLDIVLTPPDPKRPRALIIQDLGAIQNEWVARELILSYFDGQGNSPAVSSSINFTFPMNLTTPHSLNSLYLIGLHSSEYPNRQAGGWCQSYAIASLVFHFVKLYLTLFWWGFVCGPLRLWIIQPWSSSVFITVSTFPLGLKT